MCLQCPPISAAEAAQEIQEFQSDIKHIDIAIDALLAAAGDIEDQYILTGMFYHTTQIQARQPANFPQHRLDRLKQVFGRLALLSTSPSSKTWTT